MGSQCLGKLECQCWYGCWARAEIAVGGVGETACSSEEGSELETAVEDVGCQDGVGVGLVFGVGGVGEVARHLGGLRLGLMGE